MSLRTYGSLFAGVGGFDIGLDSAGLSCEFQVEIDENCQQVLSYKWPSALKYGDIKNVSGHDLPEVDLIVFGSPCQDLSSAGKKTGLSGEKSVLFYEATRIIKEMREKTNGQYPKWSIWENVVGALSTNSGADFGQVLWEMDEAGACFSEWAVLDAQYFGVPQQRRRVYLLSVFDTSIAARCPSKILSVKESLSRDLKKGKKQKQDSFREVANCLRSGGIGGLPSSRGENLIISVNSYTPLSFGEYKERIGVRRLTPIECERLMGWPDNHTLYRSDGKENSDTIRYKMCGNGVVSPVVEWIVLQIKEV